MRAGTDTSVRNDLPTTLLDQFVAGRTELLDHQAVDLAHAREATYVVSNEITYEYPAPIRRLRHQLVVIPRRRHGDQRRLAHRLRADLPHDAAMRRRDDRFGNAVVEIHADEIGERFSFGLHAVVHRCRDRAEQRSWHDVHRAPTPLTATDRALREAAHDLAPAATGLDAALAIGEAVRGEMADAPGATTVRTSAAEAWSLRRGVCQDMAHVMIAMCRTRGLHARYVSGHLLGDGASHAWVEVHDRWTPARPGLAFDPTHGREADLRYVTVAVGRDYRDVAPTAGSYGAGPPGSLTVHKRVALASVG